VVRAMNTGDKLFLLMLIAELGTLYLTTKAMDKVPK